jgi:hypothetical protein
MDRLDTELQRLYLAPPTQGSIDPDAEVRAIVLEGVGPAAWPELSRLWQAVQAELDLPAPAIAVNGRDGCQLWFSLVQPVPRGRAERFVAALRANYLASVPAERIRSAAPDAPPPAQVAPERWSAFVAPDLAPLFAEDPWLDHPPGRDAQADLLSRVASIAPEAFERACALRDAAAPPPAGAPVAASAAADPRAFLLSVMQDPSVDLRLRIEAAKALL